MSRYLSKSRFALALECPTKLYYHSQPTYYANSRVDNDFLQALADGGFQVGALARAYYPEGVLIDELDIASAASKTSMLLELENVTIFEPAFIYKDFCVRADIFLKRGDFIQLIEVKAKSISENEEFLGKKGELTSTWRKYVYDVAFQKYVISKALPNSKVSAYLMLVNKSKRTSVDGLNQRFLLQKKNGRTSVVIKGDLSPETLGDPILVTRNVDDVVERIYSGTDHVNTAHTSFESMITEWANAFKDNIKLGHPLGGTCASCEFITNEENKTNLLRSGFEECWKENAGFKDADFTRPSVLKIWNYRKKDDAIRGGKYFQEQFDASDFRPIKVKDANEPGWTTSERQSLQVHKSRLGDNTHEIDVEVMTGYMCQWKFPLHMIDFETTAVAIPFNKGRRPYEQVAFQFSHHTIDENGTVTHQGQWINTKPGYFPNFDFIRALKAELQDDDGTIFRYSAHENTVLNAIKSQLEASEEPDKGELINFIKSITNSTEKSVEQWNGERNMVDLLEVVKRCYYHPETGGSNSLKFVLPAVVSCSEYLQQKYSKADYGIAIKSLNFNGHQWLQRNEKGSIINPYKTLPQIHEGIDNESLDTLEFYDSREIAEGGAAMTAYARMQFTEMSGKERERITNALLRYCELDTLAMVMLYEAWRDWCK